MPLDYAILAKFDPAGRSQDILRSVGKTDYIFSVYNNDIQLNASKQLRTVEGTDKLVQSVLKIILTKKGENFEDPEYGTTFDETIGGKLIQEQYVAIRSSIVDALAYYNQLNSDNENLDEIIANVTEVSVKQSEKAYLFSIGNRFR
jgi:phage baseplate assembly protein W